MTNQKGRFGIHGGQYIPETLMKAVIELEDAYNRLRDDPDFKAFYEQNSLVPAWAEGEDFVKILAKQTEQVKESLASLKK